MLFMSDSPVKFRIDYILSQNYFYLHFIISPVLAGGFLAIVTPYAQWSLSKAHKWAEERQRDNIFLSKSEDFKDAIKLSKLRVQSDRAVETENAKIDADIQAEIERGKREALVTKELEVSKKTLTEELEMLNKSIAVHREEKVKIQDLIVESLSVMERFFTIDDSNSIQQLKNDVNKLYSESQLEASIIRNAIKNGIELTEQQILTVFEQAEEVIKNKK
ncbi:hypothetical protein J1778_01170 [Rahnella sp. H11b]|uniref:Uncharacterized protein n=2 Tax=Rahnella bonaserana TaxID=2816248 RepID=A0ABS6LPM7_9GAMM|nr:hypothetical protein [Rahnella bonaserana]